MATVEPVEMLEKWNQATALQDDHDIIVLGLDFNLHALRHPELKERVAAQRRENIALIARFIDEQAQQAGVTLAFPAETLAGIFAAASDGFSVAAQFDPRAGELFKLLVQLLTPAIMGASTPVPAPELPKRRRTASRGAKPS